MTEVQRFSRARRWAISRRRPIGQLRISRVRAKRLIIEFEQMRRQPNLLNFERAMLLGKATIFDIALSWPVPA